MPGPVWRTLTRLGAWIEPVLVQEWARLMRGYAERMGTAMPLGQAEAALVWEEPLRDTALGRLAAERLRESGYEPICVWSGSPLSMQALDIDHCLPWSAWPCGDLWNLLPADRRVNQHQKRDRLPSQATLAAARSRIIHWWEGA
ncbi:HNH endonuclease domain-containing protein [Sphingomonas sp. MA1305]|uniref:HNH endonuclease domain-containing protein n=1 Tax=Sphingomonas sp. MA1305 TaxID=2479204 RepID=UPI0018DFADC0